jgi:pyruvate ferredoxin oxidoreductase gamma subunit
MHQIRIHGRGGQGVVTAAELIAIAAFNDGKEAQAFPSFGVERTGAPTRLSRASTVSIRIREHVYCPDVLIIQDATLLDSVDVAHGASAGTLVIINTAKTGKELKFALGEDNRKLLDKNIHTVDATKIALEIIGKNLMNTVILGAFAKVTGLVSLAALKEAVRQKFGEKGGEIVEKNIKAIEEAYRK